MFKIIKYLIFSPNFFPTFLFSREKFRKVGWEHFSLQGREGEKKGGDWRDWGEKRDSGKGEAERGKGKGEGVDQYPNVDMGDV